MNNNELKEKIKGNTQEIIDRLSNIATGLGTTLEFENVNITGDKNTIKIEGNTEMVEGELNQVGQELDKKIEWANKQIPHDSFYYNGYRQALFELKEYLQQRSKGK